MATGPRPTKAQLKAMPATCGDCVHHSRADHECRAHPPTAFIVVDPDTGDRATTAVFPPIRSTHKACGEFKPKQ